MAGDVEVVDPDFDAAEFGCVLEYIHVAYCLQVEAEIEADGAGRPRL